MPQASTKPSFINNKPRIRALRAIRLWIEEGRLPKGERLPSEEALAERLKVARSAVRGALKQLEDEGVLRPDGRGRMVRPVADRPVVSAPKGVGLMAQTLAFLTDAPGEVPSYQQVPGWWGYVQIGAISAIRAAGFHSLTLSPENFDGQQAQRLIDERPRGVIALRDAVLNERGRSALDAIKAAGIPVVVYGSDLELTPYDRVSSNHTLGSYALTKWLISQGRKRIVRMWMRDSDTRPQWLAERDAGYEQAVREAGIESLPPIETRAVGLYPANMELFDACTRLTAGYLMDHIGPGKPGIDAIMVASDGLIYPAAAALERFGLVPNKDVAIVGYDNYWVDVPERRFAPIMPLATVDKKNVKIGTALVDLFLARERGELGPEPAHVVIDPELIVLSGERQDG